MVNFSIQVDGSCGGDMDTEEDSRPQLRFNSSVIAEGAPVVPLDLFDLTSEQCNTSEERSHTEGHTCSQCASCLRCDVGSHELDIQTYCGQFTARKYSHLRRSDQNVNTLLCFQCRQYVLSTVQLSKQWSCAWPSVITSLLSLEKYKEIRVHLWGMLPTSFKQWWHLVAEAENLNVNEPGVFTDNTFTRKRFERLVNSGVIADFLTAMTEYAFPCVKCPAGCFAYGDEMNLLQFHHFIEWKFNVPIFNSKKSLLTGARSDWPSVSLQLEQFSVKPGLIIDCDGGLSVLFCSAHGKDLKAAFVHVPTNPVLKDHGLQYPDHCAAAILTPNVIRAGKMCRYTNSTHTIRAVGGYTGISSSTLACSVDRTIQDERLAMAECLAISHR